MAAGPVVGAAILASVHPEEALAAAGMPATPSRPSSTPAWRWVFYLNIPIGIIALTLAWAAVARLGDAAPPGRVDIVGRRAVRRRARRRPDRADPDRLDRDRRARRVDPVVVTAGLLAVAVVASAIAVVRGLRVDDPFIDPRLFRSVPFSSAALVSLLTGYAFATAIIGGAVFVDRVLYGGPDEQRLALGALAGATALGALASGLRRPRRAAPARRAGRARC